MHDPGSATQASIIVSGIDVMRNTVTGKVVDRLNGKRCNLLKLDCEGAEFEIIKSIDREMAQKIAHIIFEASYSQYDFKELNQHLTGLGYQVGKFKGMHVADLIKSYT